MKKAIVYASTTGNTEAMANAVVEGAKASGAVTVSGSATGQTALPVQGQV